jgi:hypothetical protein
MITFFALLKARIRRMLLGRRIHRPASVTGQGRLLLYVADSTRLKDRPLSDMDSRAGYRRPAEVVASYTYYSAGPLLCRGLEGSQYPSHC